MRGPDLNRRPSGYEPDELPDCSTPRCSVSAVPRIELGVVLLHAFIKRQSRDTMQALDQALSILARIRERPELEAEYIVKEETL